MSKLELLEQQIPTMTSKREALANVMTTTSKRDVGKRHDNDVNDETAAAHGDNDVKMKDGDDEQNDPGKQAIGKYF